jgi:hypothetical protein
MGAELFHADRQTDMTKLVVAFSNFAKAPKNVSVMFSRDHEMSRAMKGAVLN